MKQRILGSAIGQWALSLRGFSKVIHAAYFRPETVGTIANDHLALRLLYRLCESGKIFVDAGAHLGSVLSMVLHYDPTVRIVAIEAMPDKAALLRKKFPTVEVHSCAVGESEGEAVLFIDTAATGGSSLLSPGADQSERKTISVPVKRLDDIVDLSSDVDVMKVHVVGGELPVLKGSVDIIAKSRPLLNFESAIRQSGALEADGDLWEFLNERDYVVVVPNRVAHNDDGLNKDGFLEGHLYPRRATYYFGIPRERRIEIRDKARRILRI